MDESAQALAEHTQFQEFVCLFSQSFTAYRHHAEAFDQFLYVHLKPMTLLQSKDQKVMVELR